MVLLLGNASPPTILPRDRFRGGGGNGGVSCSSLCLHDINKSYGMRRRSATVKAAVFWRKEMPTEVEMESINNIEQLDEILRQLQEEHHSIVIEWMAEWCRKCKYLKPKLENLAGEFHPKVKFYSVDVNKVSQALIKRGNISKMPTIQLWKDGEMKAEIIGGHKAWLVVEEVREMIQTYI